MMSWADFFGLVRLVREERRGLLDEEDELGGTWGCGWEFEPLEDWARMASRVGW